MFGTEQLAVSVVKRLLQQKKEATSLGFDKCFWSMLETWFFQDRHCLYRLSLYRYQHIFTYTVDDDFPKGWSCMFSEVFGTQKRKPITVQVAGFALVFPLNGKILLQSERIRLWRGEGSWFPFLGSILQENHSLSVHELPSCTGGSLKLGWELNACWSLTRNINVQVAGGWAGSFSYFRGPCESAFFPYPLGQSDSRVVKRQWHHHHQWHLHHFYQTYPCLWPHPSFGQTRANGLSPNQLSSEKKGVCVRVKGWNC